MGAMTLPPDAPYLRAVADAQEHASHLHPYAPEDDNPFRPGVSACTREEYHKAQADKWTAERGRCRSLSDAGMESVRVRVNVLRDLTLHESRFYAAKWLESIGRPGWRFLDGPGPLTPEQSARALHEAVVRARDGQPQG
jgi:hypothetical protein